MGHARASGSRRSAARAARPATPAEAGSWTGHSAGRHLASRRRPRRAAASLLVFLYHVEPPFLPTSLSEGASVSYESVENRLHDALLLLLERLGDLDGGLCVLGEQCPYRLD